MNVGIQRTAETLEKAIADAWEALKKDPKDVAAFYSRAISEYHYSWGVRGDNTPESAVYLGYLDFKELYPGVTGRTIRDFFREVLAGKGSGIRY